MTSTAVNIGASTSAAEVLSSALSTALSTALASTPTALSTFTSTPVSPTTSAATATATSGSGSNGGSGGHPLLFFVALGFGVVFTNLWIIVGVKYCFRYRRRQRAMLDAETGEPIDMGTMQRPRRRRIKKLMSMEEVNERFPLVKYKHWRATREQSGLPAAGGVTAPPSRAASIKGAMMERVSTEVESARAGSLTAPAGTDAARASTDGKDAAAVTAARVSDAEKAPQSDKDGAHAGHDDDEDDDPIQTAVAADLLNSPGDSCAICIDTIEDDDEVRGLTCGHAFHAGCIDPWLTGRRACCPLCKADYYVPKPGAANREAAADAAEGDDRTGVAAASASQFYPGLQPPMSAWAAFRGGVPLRGRVVVAGSRYQYDMASRYRPPGWAAQQQAARDAEAGNGQAPDPSSEPAPSGWRARLGRLRPGRRAPVASEAQDVEAVAGAEAGSVPAAPFLAPTVVVSAPHDAPAPALATAIEPAAAESAPAPQEAPTPASEPAPQPTATPTTTGQP